MNAIKRNPVATGALLALAAVLLAVWPPRTAKARMNPPIEALTMVDETTGGGTAPLDSAVFSILANKGTAAARFTVWISSGSTHEEFGFWHRPNSTGAWTFTPLLKNATLDDAEGVHTGVLGLREGWEYSFDFQGSTRGTILVEVLYDGVS